MITIIDGGGGTWTPPKPKPMSEEGAVRIGPSGVQKIR